MAIPNEILTYLDLPMMYTLHIGQPIYLDIDIKATQKVEIEVNIAPNSEMQITLNPTDIPCEPFETKVLWVNMTFIEGHDWDAWVNEKIVTNDYEFFVFGATEGTCAFRDVRKKATQLHLAPVFTMRGLNNDKGCLVIGATPWVTTELMLGGGVGGYDNNMVHKFSFMVWGMEG